MSRVASSLAVVAYLAFAATLAAQQSYAGTWVVQGQQGPVTIVLGPPAQGILRGTVSGGGFSYRIETEQRPDRLVGFAASETGSERIYFEAMLEGSGLRVLVADFDRAGEPIANTAQQFLFQRSGAASAGGPFGSGAPARGAASVGRGPQDTQITELLLSTAWCSFSFNGSTTRRERNVFSRDGTVVSTGGAETSRSARGTDQYGNDTFRGGSASQESGTTRAYWRVENGMLMLSLDGQQWQPQQLQITQNSNGSPIIIAGGTEFMRCN